MRTTELHRPVLRLAGIAVLVMVGVLSAGCAGTVTTTMTVTATATKTELETLTPAPAPTVTVTETATVTPPLPVERAPRERAAPPNAESAPESNCDPNYEGYCVPIVNYDLNCSDISGPVRVVGTDIHGFDRDRDGVGCEG